MITNIKNYSLDDCKEIIKNSIQNDGDYLKKLYIVCGKFDSLINHIIDNLEKGNTECELSDIDTINLIRINQTLPFFMLEDKYEDIHLFANAWILIIQNFIYMTGDNNKKIEESISVVAKLLQLELNFSRLIYISEVLINKYEYNIKQINDSESYKLSKTYIDKILNNKS